MGWFDITVIVIVSVAFVAAVGYIAYRKLRHKGGGCDCGCESCPHCCNCKEDKK